MCVCIRGTERKKKGERKGAWARRKRREAREGVDFQAGIQQHPREQIPLFFVRGKQTENCGVHSERVKHEQHLPPLIPSTTAAIVKSCLPILEIWIFPENHFLRPFVPLFLPSFLSFLSLSLFFSFFFSALCTRYVCRKHIRSELSSNRALVGFSLRFAFHSYFCCLGVQRCWRPATERDEKSSVIPTVVTLSKTWNLLDLVLKRGNFYLDGPEFVCSLSLSLSFFSLIVLHAMGGKVRILFFSRIVKFKYGIFGRLIESIVIFKIKVSLCTTFLRFWLYQTMNIMVKMLIIFFWNVFDEQIDHSLYRKKNFSLPLSMYHFLIPQHRYPFIQYLTQYHLNII